jgi:transcriptional regulator with XRE-family HTH domain
MDLLQVRDEVRAYMATHPTKSQEEMAEEVGVSASWLNKFLCGQFNNLGLERLHVMYEWMKRDKRSARG